MNTKLNNLDVELVSLSQYVGRQEHKGKRVDKGSSPAIIEIDGVRFFSLAPADFAHSCKINKALGWTEDASYS